MGPETPTITSMPRRPGRRVGCGVARSKVSLGSASGSPGSASGVAGRQSGFTLLELLLVTALLLMLLGAAVFNFNLLQRGAALEEGAAQFEALVRFARAQAAQTGRPVQINFEDEVLEGVGVSLGGLHVVWQSDPLEQPGCWSELAVAQPLAQEVARHVAVWDVRAAEPGAELTEATPPEPLEGDEEMLWGLLPPITFYPDGSSDSAEVTLVSREAEDTRQVVVVIDGLTGRIWRQLQSPPTETEGSPVESGSPPTIPPPQTPQIKPASAERTWPQAVRFSPTPNGATAVASGQPRSAL